MELYAAMALEGDTDGSKIGLNDYPTPGGYEPNAFRQALNEKIIRHYYTREIGMETIGLFTWAVRRRMWEIMPLYVQVYESELIKFDPLSSVKLDTTREDTASEHTERSSNNSTVSGGTSGSRSVNSEFPQAMLQPDEDYASQGADVTSASNNTSEGNGQDAGDTATTGNGTSTTSGYQGAASDLLLKYRATFLNVDMLVIRELADCFLQIWDNGEEYLPADSVLFNLF